jgi:hypothetical protein
MAKELVTYELWEGIKSLLPEEPPKPKGGRPRIDDRAALTGILFVLKGGIPREMLPQEMGCGSGISCWRRLKKWHEAGVRGSDCWYRGSWIHLSAIHGARRRVDCGCCSPTKELRVLPTLG